MDRKSLQEILAFLPPNIDNGRLTRKMKRFQTVMEISHLSLTDKCYPDQAFTVYSSFNTSFLNFFNFSVFNSLIFIHLYFFFSKVIIFLVIIAFRILYLLILFYLEVYYLTSQICLTNPLSCVSILLCLSSSL